MDWSYPGGSEETDFAWRAQLAGLGVVTVSHAVVQYRLKHDVRAIFRQQRIQQRGRVLLWVRFSAHGMSGPSWRHSLHMSLASAIRLLLARSERTRLGEALTIGGHVGALEGMLLYRFFRARPGRRLMSGSNPF
jgi:GT2 family glycosyltransferase